MMERGVPNNTINCNSSTQTNMNRKTESQNYIPQKKNKKVTEMKKDPTDTVSETISFVIKGQLTPIKPTPVKLDKEIKTDKLPDKTRIDITVKTPTKVQTKTAKMLSKESPKKNMSKDATKVIKTNLVKNSIVNLSNAQKIIDEVSKENFEVSVSKLDNPINLDSKKIETKKKTEPRQKSSEKNEKSSGKTSRDNSKSKNIDDKANKISKSSEDKNDKAKFKPESRSNSAEKGSKKDSTKLDIPKKKLVKSKVMSQEKKEKLLLKAKLLKKSLEMKNKTKQILPKKVIKNKEDKCIEKNPISTRDCKDKPENEKRVLDKKQTTTKEKIIDLSSIEIKKEKLDSKNETKKEKLAKKLRERKLAKIKINPIVKKKLLTPISKKELVKKKILSKKKRFLTKEERRKEKLYKFWNAPKRHRVASLNALAKVHCLYENESKALFDKIAEQGMIKRVIKQELIEKDSGVKKKKDIKDSQSESDETSESEEEEEPCTRTLRCVPGLRGAGKHWDPNALSSDENVSDVETVSSKSIPVKRVRIKKEPKEENEVVAKKKRGAQKGKKRIRRPKSPQHIDLKDLVVSKRMASLNASAILAASYSNDKKTKFSKREDTDTDDSSADEYFAALDQLEPPKKIKLLEEIKVEKVDKDEDRKVIEVHTTPNKKVAVIVNQEADVTITGVYVNSTTRSTHHEGYCSIAGMQYRISATSHTQTAATAVATETVLQGTNAAQENPPPEPQRSCSSSQSYAPLDALSNMQPPPGPGIHQQGPPPPSGHHVMPPPGHQMTSPPHHRQHQAAPPPPGCSSSAFSPHHTPSCGAPPGVGPSPGSHTSGDSPYHSGYYQPAGPLIPSAYSHTHVQPPLIPQAPPPPPLSKSASLSDTGASSTPSSTTSPMVIPAVGSHMGQAPPPPSSSNGGDSDNEVIITSVTSGSKELPPSSHSTPISYRAYSHYPPPPPSDLRYSAYPPYASYHYPSPAPPPNSYPSPHHPSHADLCYPMVYHPAKYGTSYRRYLATSSQYYQAPPPSGSELYSGQSGPAPVPPGPAPSGPPSQQVVTVSPSSSAPQYPPSGGPTGPPPPPTIMEPYSTPPTLVETSYPPPPPPHHYYPPGYAIPPPQCYSHPSNRIPYAHTYQPCPCPMQSCPKNVLTGPLTGDGGKRSNISKDSIPLPPVASLALPLEPASATGPPSPARGSAGMPPPPSPAGAVYQATPPAPKQEARSPEVQECGQEKKRKARVGKAMVRSNMQQNTMLLMCNPSQNCNVKREIESPKDKEELQKKETVLTPAIVPPPMPEPLIDKDQIKDTCALLKTEAKDDQTVNPTKTNVISTEITSESIAKNLDKITETSANLDVQEKENTDANINQVIPEVEKPSLPSVPNVVEQEPLPPCIKTVAENVKVKNMKRKQSMEEAAAKEQQQNNNVPDHNSPPAAKKAKLSSYKNVIKKKRNIISKEQTNNKRMKLNCKQKIVAKRVFRKIIKNNNNNNTKVTNNGNKALLKTVDNVKSTNKSTTKTVDIQKTCSKSVTKVSENAKPSHNCNKKLTDNGKATNNGNKTAVKVLDNLIAKNNVDKTIDEVINIGKEDNVVPVKNPKDPKNPEVKEKHTTKPKTFEPKPSIVCKKLGSAKRKSSAIRGSEKESTKSEVVPKVPRKSLQGPRWSNGWCWEGEPFEAKVFVNSDDVTCIRKCYPMMRHESGDILVPRDCVLLAGPKKNDLPFVAKIAYLWENPEDGEMMMSLLWYYRPEHTEQGRLPGDQSDEVFASKHKDCNSVACIDDKCYVLTYNEYCRYRRDFRSREEGIEKKSPCIPTSESYPRAGRQPEENVSAENIFFCRKVYDFRQKRIIKNPT